MRLALGNRPSPCQPKSVFQIPEPEIEKTLAALETDRLMVALFPVKLNVSPVSVAPVIVSLLVEMFALTVELDATMILAQVPKTLTTALPPIAGEVTKTEFDVLLIGI